MASESKKTKTETAPKADTTPKKDTAPKVEGIAAKDAPKEAIKDAAKDASKDASKSDGAESATAAPSSYSRGEGQKPVTAAYKENWNAIFGKKKKRR
jgi:hypothetical protein